MGDALNELEARKLTVWVPVVRAADEADPAFLLDDDCEWSAPALVCLEIREDGTLIIGEPGPEQDERMSDLLLVNRCGEA